MKTLFLSLALLAGAPLAASAAPAYVPVGAVPLGAPDRWDYVAVAGGRVYVAHGDRLEVVDAASGARLGAVQGIAGGAHGAVASPATGQGFTDDGRAGEAIAFDLATLKVLKRIPAAPDADGIVADPTSGHVFVIEGDSRSVSVIDPRSDVVIATIAVGEKLEFGAADGHGSVYVAGEEKGDLLRIDVRTNRVADRWPLPACESPHGVAVDEAAGRVFVGCVNAKMMAVDARSGHVAAELVIGRGSDAIAFDPVRRRVFSSNGRDGTVSVYMADIGGGYVALDPISAAVSGRTLAVDPASGRLFVAAAETEPPAEAGGRPRTRPGSLKLLIFDPTPGTAEKGAFGTPAARPRP